MVKSKWLAVMALGLGLLIPSLAAAATYFIPANGRCYVIERKNVINQYYIIYKCRTCECQKRDKEATGFQSMNEAMRYLEKKYGEIERR
jgi:hypothetical protein